MLRATQIVLATALLGSATWAGPGAAPPEPPDLTGTWKLQADSAPAGARRRSGGGEPRGEPAGRPPGGGGEGRLAGILGAGPARMLTIAQTDSTVTINGERGPAWTYFTDGREVRRELPDSASVVVRAWWDDDDLIIERRGEEWIAVEAYRFDAKGPRLIVIVEFTPAEESRDRARAFRTSRIYQRAADDGSPAEADSTPG